MSKSSMRMISLNTWGGKKFDSLMKFVHNQKDRTDVFCFQEIFDAEPGMKISNAWRANLFYELTQALEGFQSFFVPYLQNHNFKEKTDFPLTYGNAMFVRAGIK